MSAALIALWALLFAFPPTVRGRHAMHNVLWIVKPLGPINPDGSVTAYAHVQERGEYRLHKLLGMAAGVPFLFAPSDPYWLAAMLFAMLVVDGGTRRLDFIDYAGHGAELLAAEADGLTGYRAAEIARMKPNKDKQGDNVALLLLRWEWLAHIVWRLGR